MNDLYDVLTKSHNASAFFNDAEIINKYIAFYGKEQNINAPRNTDMRTILNEWSNNKKYLYSLLNNSLAIRSGPIVLSGRGQAEKMVNALDKYGGNNFIKQLIEKSKTIPELNTIIDTACLPINLFNNKWFFGNIKKDNLIIQNGAKITTIFKKLAQYFSIDNELFNNFLQAQSMATNLKDVYNKEFTIYLSIHPLDFFTLSDNMNNWSTCLSWNEDGGSKLGTIELMNNKTAIIAYVASHDKMSIPGGKWNNKKWREIFFVDENSIVEGKAYPYRCDEFSQCAIRFLADRMKNFTHSEEIVFNATSETSSIKFIPKHKYMYNDFSKIFNDINYPNSRGHYALFTDELFNEIQKDAFTPDYRGTTTCIWCGEKIDADNKKIYGQKSNLLCINCAQVHQKCDCCGKLCFDNNIIPLPELVNKSYCGECVSSKCFIDTISCLLFPKEEQMVVYFAREPDKPTFNDKNIELLSINSKYSAIRDYKLNDYFKMFHKKMVKNAEGHYEEIIYVNKNDLIEENINNYFIFEPDYFKDTT